MTLLCTGCALFLVEESLASEYCMRLILSMQCAGRLVGNVLLAAAFASYAGPFDMALRRRLVQDIWLPDLQQRAVPMTVAIRPLDVLTNSATKVRCRRRLQAPATMPPTML